jgi:hypothetical protein
MKNLPLITICAALFSVLAWFSYIVYTLLRNRNIPQEKPSDLVLIKSIHFEIDGLQDRTIELFKRTEVFEIHETGSQIIVVTIGEAVARMKFKQIVLNYRQALKDMDRLFRVVTIKE